MEDKIEILKKQIADYEKKILEIATEKGKVEHYNKTLNETINKLNTENQKLKKIIVNLQLIQKNITDLILNNKK